MYKKYDTATIYMKTVCFKILIREVSLLWWATVLQGKKEVWVGQGDGSF